MSAAVFLASSAYRNNPNRYKPRSELPMSSSSSATATASGGGIGFFGLLALLFIALKLLGVIHWSWWVVIWPLYPAMAILGAMILFGLGFLAFFTIGHFSGKARFKPIKRRAF